VCAVLVWSHRFGDLATLPKLLEDHGYRATARYGGVKVLFTRASCAL
jgi:phosphoglycerol transferase MdoB-like AlkP superfamily enzyme